MHVQFKVAPEALKVIKALQGAGKEAYLVGGAVRDMLLGLNPRDWDVATNALPDEVLNLFDQVIPTGLRFGSVTVVSDGVPIEVTSYRGDEVYSLERKPTSLRLGVTLMEDMARRDFEPNALAYDPVKDVLVDPYHVKSELQRGIVRLKAVGCPDERFREDPLRILRAFSLAARLDCGFSVIWDSETRAAVSRRRSELSRISPERIREEVNKILVTQQAGRWLGEMANTGVLETILPEVYKLKHVVHRRNGFNLLDGLEHTFQVVNEIKPDLSLRLAALLHDIGKSETLSVDEDGTTRFYGHEKAGEQMSVLILKRLRYSNFISDTVRRLVRYHMFNYPSTEAGIRRFVSKHGWALVWNLVELRRADVLAWGGLLEPLRRFENALGFLEQSQKAISLKDLKVTGHDIMAALGVKPGPIVGQILKELLERVIENPELNNKEDLIKLALTISTRKFD